MSGQSGLGYKVGPGTSVTVQVGIFIAIVVAAIKAGGYAERAEQRLTSIEDSLQVLKKTTSGNSGDVSEVSKRVDDQQARQIELSEQMLELQKRVSTLVACSKAGKRKCNEAW